MLIPTILILLAIAAIGFQLWHFKLELWAIGVQIRYEFTSQVAADAVAYAEQQRAADFKLRSFKWQPHQLKECAMGYVRRQLVAFSVEPTQEALDACALLVEAHIAYSAGRAKPRTPGLNPTPATRMLQHGGPK